MKAICKKFNLTEQEPIEVRNADNALLALEKSNLMKPCDKNWNLEINPSISTDSIELKCYDPETAEKEFLK